MKHFRVHPKSRFHSFNILGFLVHRFFFVFYKANILKNLTTPGVLCAQNYFPPL
jgi:hypothetical protein